MDRDTLGDRMKGYESVSRPALMRRCPAIVRVDGRAFHAWTRGCAKPFDQMVLSAMLRATIAAAEEMQGCKLAYVQSDEASFLLTDYDTLETQPWFGYDLSKVVSLISANGSSIGRSKATCWRCWRRRASTGARCRTTCAADGSICRCGRRRSRT